MSDAFDEPKYSLLRLLEPELLVDPQLLYRELRENDPVHWDPYMHAWVVTSYQDSLFVVMNLSADRTPPIDHLERLGLHFMKPYSDVMLKQMMFMDGSMHARLRAICSAAFNPRRVEEMRNEIESIVDHLLDEVVAKRSMDLIADFADPLPAITTAIFLGVPVDDRKILHKWVLDLADLLGNVYHHPDRVAEIVQSLEALKAYLYARMEELRQRPNGGLLYSLMTAEVNGNKLTDEEVVANTIITLVGGHETTTNLISSGFLTLLQNPDQYRQFQNHPEIAASAVEELLRFESPVQHTARVALSDVQIAGKTIRKGDKVVAVLAAANRDPKRFHDPDRLDLMRPDNRHLAFGWAAHFCFGAPLARMEAQVAFHRLLSRIKNPKLAEQTPQWRNNAGLRGLTRLRITFD